MSERWGNCRSCGGRGQKATQVPVPLRQVETTLTPDEAAELKRLGTLEWGRVFDVTTKYVMVECGRCGGTGESGDTEDYRG